MKNTHKHKLKAANLPPLYSEEPALLLTCAGFTSELCEVKELTVQGWLCSSKSWEGSLGQDGAVNEAGGRQRTQQFPREEKGGGVKKQVWQTAVLCPLIMAACGFQVGSLQVPHLLQAFCFSLHHLQLQMATTIPRLGMLLDLAQFLKLSSLSLFFVFSSLLPATGNPFRVHWPWTHCLCLSQGDKLWQDASLS